MDISGNCNIIFIVVRKIKIIYQGGNNMDVLRISTKSNPNSVAGAIAGLIKEKGKAEMQAIGAGALNQAIKAVAIARIQSGQSIGTIIGRMIPVTRKPS